MLTLMFKMPFKTRHFNKNQTVWVKQITGAQAAKVTAKFRGKGRYVSAWVKWDNKDIKEYPLFKVIEVNDDFIQRHGLKIIETGTVGVN